MVFAVKKLILLSIVPPNSFGFQIAYATDMTVLKVGSVTMSFCLHFNILYVYFLLCLWEVFLDYLRHLLLGLEWRSGIDHLPPLQEAQSCPCTCPEARSCQSSSPRARMPSRLPGLLHAGSTYEIYAGLRVRVHTHI